MSSRVTGADHAGRPPRFRPDSVKQSRATFNWRQPALGAVIVNVRFPAGEDPGQEGTERARQRLDRGDPVQAMSAPRDSTAEKVGRSMAASGW
jgi:hypothetical protein